MLAELPQAPEVPKEFTEGISAIREYRKGFKQHWNDGVIFVFGTIAASPGRGHNDAFSSFKRDLQKYLMIHCFMKSFQIKGTVMRETHRKFTEYLTGAAFSAKEFLSQQMSQGGGGVEGEKVVKKEE